MHQLQYDKMWMEWYLYNSHIKLKMRTFILILYYQCCYVGRELEFGIDGLWAGFMLRWPVRTWLKSSLSNDQVSFCVWTGFNNLTGNYWIKQLYIPQ